MTFLKRFSHLFWYTVSLGVTSSVICLLLIMRLLREMRVQATPGMLTSKQEYLLNGHGWIHNVTIAILAMQPHALAMSPVQWLLIVVSTLYTVSCIGCFRLNYLVGCRFLAKGSTLP